MATPMSRTPLFCTSYFYKFGILSLLHHAITYDNIIHNFMRFHATIHHTILLGVYSKAPDFWKLLHFRPSLSLHWGEDLSLLSERSPARSLRHTAILQWTPMHDHSRQSVRFRHHLAKADLRSRFTVASQQGQACICQASRYPFSGCSFFTPA